MARVKRAVNAQKKRRTTLERASGYRGQRSRLYPLALRNSQVSAGVVNLVTDRSGDSARGDPVRQVEAHSHPHRPQHHQVVGSGPHHGA